MLSKKLRTRLQGDDQSQILVDDEWLLLQIKDGSCSAGCQYCYAKYETVHEFGKLGVNIDGKTASKLMKENSPTMLEMPLETIKELVTYISNAGIKKIAIIGSEPTEHSQFQNILDLLSAYNINLAIYTNGRYLERLHHPIISQIILHLSHIPTKKYMEEVKLLIKSGKKIDLRVNFSDRFLSEKNNINAFLSYLTAQEKKTILIKYSITSRVLTEKIDGFGIDDLKFIKKDLFSYFEQLHEIHPEVTLFCERSLFKCCFTDNELEKYSYANIVFKCSMEFIIYRDRKLKFCSPGRYLFEGYLINSAEDILKSLPKVRQKKEELFSLSSFPECKKCKHRIELECYGGCISYKDNVQL
jgi:organic radical activating enzyme